MRPILICRRISLYCESNFFAKTDRVTDVVRKRGVIQH